jgi:hypothetical protein
MPENQTFCKNYFRKNVRPYGYPNYILHMDGLVFPRLAKFARKTSKRSNVSAIDYG